MVGRALTSIPSFTCAATEDYDKYLCDFHGKIGPQGYAIPPAFWTNVLFLKLEGPAKSWYNTTYTTQNLRPEWEDLTAGLQRLFGQWYARRMPVLRGNTPATCVGPGCAAAHPRASLCSDAAKCARQPGTYGTDVLYPTRPADGG